ncbi:MAG: HlyD family efflux transporter periplasmic adaptor subunit [Anaerolineae bacterium]|nr:HlyD family efflux transporter periplasmic adaptor subunit [Anaerolineae bacterium]MBT7070086.1 HlyD family efflux transporter periplasmic adaptor subunit [Anaerolineae bacterium]MBT7326499.1 HlyD family efflux transporter periplasmic adaptor subunit [Anaerolineae bacterium]
MKRFAILSTFVLFAALLSACGAAAPATAEETPLPPVTVESAIIAEGRLEPIQYAEPAFSAAGVIGDVFVAEGDTVAEGDLIARLENTDALEADVARAETVVLNEVADAYEALRVAQQRLDNYSVPSKFNELTPVEAAAEMSIKVDAAREAYDPYTGYDNPRGYIKDLKEELDNAWADYNQALEWMSREADLDAAELRLAQAQADYASLQSGDASVVQSNLSAAQVALSNAELRSPIGGTVANLNIKVGEAVNMGQVDVTIADFSNWLVMTTDLTELDVVNITEGQTVIVTLDAISDFPLNGTVLSIGQTFSQNQGDVVYEVTIALDETHPAMRWGMTALVEFVE